MKGLNNPNTRVAQWSVRAELIGDDTARADGIVGHGNCPILKLCRMLVDAGRDPATPLEAWRNDVLCLTVRSIGIGAKLELNADGTGFRRCRCQPDRGLPVAPPPVWGSP